MAKSKKIDVYTVKECCKIFDCTRVWFAKKWQPQLTKLPRIDKRCLFDAKEVMALKATKINTSESPYNILG